MSDRGIMSDSRLAVGAAMAMSADIRLQGVLKTGSIKYSWREDACAVPYSPAQTDAQMEEMLHFALCAGIKWDNTKRDNMVAAVKAMIEAANPLYCGPAADYCDIPEFKKLWLQTDTKKLFQKCENVSDDCCDKTYFWQQIGGGNLIGPEKPEPVKFTGLSTDTPPADATVWCQTDTCKILTLTDVNGELVWVQTGILIEGQ